jgi:NADPH2:quinone reductase
MTIASSPPLIVCRLGHEGVFGSVSMTLSFLGEAVPAQARVGEATGSRAGRRHRRVEARLAREADGAERARVGDAPAPAGGRPMKAMRDARRGDPAGLEIVDRAIPEPAAGEARVEVEAAGLSSSDIGRRRGLSLDATPLAFAPGAEIVGRVRARGAGLSTRAVGGRAAGVTATRAGGDAERCAIAAGLVTCTADELDASTAVAVPIPGATVLRALETMARLPAGDIVVVTAAAGGGGGLAVQRARALGASKVVAPASASAKRAHARGLGADVAIDVTSAGLRDEHRDAARGRGFNVVLDRVGGEVASALVDAFGPLGRLVRVGVAFGAPRSGPSHGMMKRAVRVSGLHLDAVVAVSGRCMATLGRVCALVASGVLVPHLGIEAPLAQAAEVHAALESRAHFGERARSVRAGTGKNAARSMGGAA